MCKPDEDQKWADAAGEDREGDFEASSSDQGRATLRARVSESSQGTGVGEADARSDQGFCREQ